MKLRRLEISVIGVTLAFACFMGGFFTGRNWNTVNIVPLTVQNGEHHTPVSLAQPEQNTRQEPQPSPAPDTSSDDITQIPAANPVNQNTTETPGQPTGGDGRININIATQSELTDLPGIGNVLAARIVDYRRMHGSFNRIEDLRNVSGIGEKRYEAIADKITIG